MSILKAFTGHLMEFVTEIKKVFPEDADLRTGYFFLEGLVKVNPKSVILGWKECVNEPYKEEILRGDVDYFIDKDYENLKQGQIVSVKVEEASEYDLWGKVI